VPRIELRPRKAPRQARSERTVQTLLAAAARVLERESLAGFNTNRVAEVAGVSVGSLYQYFPNKEALVAALIDRHQEALAEAIESCVMAHAGQPLRTTLVALAAILIEQQYRQPLLAAALDHEEQRLPVKERLRPGGQRIGAAVGALLARHRGEWPGALPAAAVPDLLVITKALVEADAQAGRVPAPDLAQRIVRAQVGYLHGAPAAKGRTRARAR
jgi:AcrR family transcriptional regulator